jgi:phosphoglycolate phosphatase-like HAD superfamily hydrolase
MKKLMFIIPAVLCILPMACDWEAKKNSANTDIQEAEIDYLTSWSDGNSKNAIIDFVSKTTTEGSAFYIPASDRIACFDNDGTLWSEQPMYFQLAFALDRITAMAPEHPEWKTKQPFKALLEGDLKTALSGGEHALLEIVMATHAGMTTEEFSAIVKEWINNAKHPQTKKLYKQMVYKPMLELLDYLRANGYKTFIVSGGGIDFMRPWVEEVYGIPPDQVVGSSGKVKYEVNNGFPEIVKLPEINFIDDKEGKPVGIHQYIGKRPAFTAGNSDGDYAMLQWTTAGSGARFGMIIHHTDSLREYAYDRESSIGRLNKGLDDAVTNNWVVVDMKEDWKEIYSDR